MLALGIAHVSQLRLKEVEEHEKLFDGTDTIVRFGERCFPSRRDEFFFKEVEDATC